MAKNKDPVKQALASIQANLKNKEAAMLMEGGASSDVDMVIPTGISVVDHFLLGVGGLPVGRVVELYGGEGSGKTSFTLQCLAGVQKDGGVPILIETEAALDTERADTFELARGNAIIMQPSTCEEVQDCLLSSIKAAPGGKTPTLIAWDSIAQTPLESEIDDGDSKPGEKARFLSALCRKVVGPASKKNVCLLFVNQIRDTIGNMFGPKIATPGGHGVKFASTIRIGFFGGQAVKNGSVEVGKAPLVKTVKNKLHPPGKSIRLPLLYESGWDEQGSVIDLAKTLGVIKKGARLSEKTYNEALQGLEDRSWR